MQDYITRDDLLDLGVKETEVDDILAKLNDKAEQLIGDEIVGQLDESDVQKLVDLQDTADDDELGKWIAEHVPDYPAIVQDNIDIVLGEFAQSLPEPEA